MVYLEPGDEDIGVRMLIAVLILCAVIFVMAML